MRHSPRLSYSISTQNWLQCNPRLGNKPRSRAPWCIHSFFCLTGRLCRRASILTNSEWPCLHLARKFYCFFHVLLSLLSEALAAFKTLPFRRSSPSGLAVQTMINYSSSQSNAKAPERLQKRGFFKMRLTYSSRLVGAALACS